MRFQAEHKIFRRRPPLEFSETDAPDWLTSCRTVKGSTMDGRWFWEEHVLTLKVGQSVSTDFNTITRIK